MTPIIGWQIDNFGHSAVQAHLLGVEIVGLDIDPIGEEAKWRKIIRPRDIFSISLSFCRAGETEGTDAFLSQRR
ncbi:hypothetical protein K2173_005514 [Erythroxylum novogranatense]|uniref:Uncharacterized protein n=1 Tax=Erythroxylum novogranatense TaxID=1862640 RepID=A0AAV8SL50_9ROSI|nr:hypothetical protein K2173_005514 [Erythroxylum novogranatense]